MELGKGARLLFVKETTFLKKPDVDASPTAKVPDEILTHESQMRQAKTRRKLCVATLLREK